MSLVLVTGGAGFIGANLVRALLDEGRDVRVLDDLSAGRRDYLEGLPVKVVEGSITDASVVRRAARGADAIVHLAARSGVAPSVADPRADFAVNVLGTHNVLDAARVRGVDRVIFASSGAVLAGETPPLHEGMVPSPLAPYGASKLYGEAALQAFASAYGLTGVVLRFSNVYGPFSVHKKSAVAAFLRRARRKQPFVVYGNGRQTRDFLFVDDVTAAIGKALTTKRSGVYQLGTGVETSVNELVRLVARLAGTRAAIDRRPARGAEAARNYTDIRRARSALRWSPAVALPEGLVRTLAWIDEWEDRRPRRKR